MAQRAHGQTRSNNSPEEFKRRITAQIVLLLADTAAMIFWALLASDG